MNILNIKKMNKMGATLKEISGNYNLSYAILTIGWLYIKRY